MNKSRLIKDVLRFKHRHSKTASFRLQDEDLVPVAESVLSAIDMYGQRVAQHNVATLKHCPEKRLVFRIDTLRTAGATFIVKVFPLRRIKHRLRYHWTKYGRYAFNEAANLIIAAQREVRVPKVYGYGRICDSYRLTKASLVILECLAQYTPANELLELNRDDERQCARILTSTIPVFISLHKAHCNIVYILSDAILLNGDNSDAFVVDFEYARFYNKSSLETLAYEAAYFARSCPDWLERRIIDDWFAQLLTAAGIRDESTQMKLMGRFNYYFRANLSHKGSVNIR